MKIGGKKILYILYKKNTAVLAKITQFKWHGFEF